MGLDIYFYKTKFKSEKKNHYDVFTDFYQYHQNEVSKILDTYIGKLSKLNEFGTKYNDTYRRCVNRIASMISLPEYYLDSVGYVKGKYGDKVLPLPLSYLKKNRDKIVANSFPSHGAYFRKVWYIFDFYKQSGKIVDDSFCFLTKDDIYSLINHCDKTLEENIFFDEYGIDVIKDVKEQMIKFVSKINKREQILVNFSY